MVMTVLQLDSTYWEASGIISAKTSRSPFPTTKMTHLEEFLVTLH